jgi:hypothetical protein
LRCVGSAATGRRRGVRCVRAASVKGTDCGAQEQSPHSGERQAVGNRNGNGVVEGGWGAHANNIIKQRQPSGGALRELERILQSGSGSLGTALS